MTRRHGWSIALVALAAVLALYAHTLHFGFYWDDYDDLRPWTWADLWRAFHGQYQPWAREGFYFYRPLTSAYFAAATAMFGLNSTALHAIPLVTLTIAATLAGIVAARETGRREAGLIAALLYAAHPLTASAVGPWIANQYQGFLVIAVLAALLSWRAQAEARRGLSPSLIVALVAAAWLKEDGLVLGPALALMHIARASITRDVPPPRRALIGGLLGLCAALILWRALWLPALFGYGLPTAGQIAANLTRAWRYALLWHVGAAPVWQVVTFTKAALLAGAAWALLRQRDGASSRLTVTATTLMFVMNLPLALVSSESRWHVMGLASVWIATAALLAVPPRARTLAVAAVALVFAVGAWPRINNFAPCAADTLEHNRWVLDTVTELPLELRRWVETRDAACADGRDERFTVPMRDMRWGSR